MFNGSKTISLLCGLLLIIGDLGYDKIPEHPSILRLNINTHVIPATDNETTYEIKVCLAIKDKTTPLYPAVYMLDAYRNFEHIALETILMQEAGIIPPIILVGISYNGIDSAKFEEQRLKDLSIPLAKDVEQQMKESMPFFQGKTLGGGETFLQNLHTTIIPEIESIYGIDSKDRTLSGNSIGGLFAVYALLQNGETFKNYIIGSPSLWWGNNQIFSLIRNNESLVSRTTQHNIFLAVGSLEQEPGNEWFQMIDNVKKLETNLLEISPNHLKIHREVIENQTHGSMPSKIWPRGIQWVFSNKD